MARLLKDPVDEVSESQAAEQNEELEKVFDISNLKMADFKSAMLADARTRHPFDGYPDKKVQIGTYTERGGTEKPLIVNLTHILVFKEEVHQDPSGKVVSLGFPELRNNEGKVIRPNTERIGTIPTAHNRRAKDYESGGVDIDCVFDRTIRLADGELSQCCIIPSPSVRAQIVFRYNSKTQRIEPDQRYLMADKGQTSRLRRVFEMIINPRIRLEESIRKSFDEAGDTSTAASLPGIPEGELRMAKACADIKPTGMRQRDEVDLLYDIVSSIQGICEKLDADAGASIVLATYEANCYTALFSGSIEDSHGNLINNFITPSSSVPEPVFITPRGIGNRERVDVLYKIMDMLETLTEQLDTDNCASSAYEATNYTAVVLYLVENSKSLTMGNGTEFRFHLGSVPQKEYIELLYQIIRCIHLTTAALDADGNADTDYDSLWYTNNILLTVENGSGDSIGN